MYKKILACDWCQIALVWLGWQLIFFVAAALITHFEPLGYQPTYALYQVLEDSPLPPFLARLGGFDGVHYQTIIHHRGYREIGGIQAFFPLYPLCLYLVNFITRQTIVSGLLISSVAFYGFLLLAFRWVRSHTDTKTAWWFIALLLCLPGGIFYPAVYTESLFLFLLVATFYAYDRQNFLLSALCGALLSACRIVGIIAPIALIVDYSYRQYNQHKLTNSDTVCNIFVLSFGVTGLIAYMLYLYFTFGDPLMFMHVQADFGAGRDAVHLITLPQVFWRYAKMCFVGFSSWTEGYRVWQELLVSTAYLVGLLAASWHVFRRRQPSIPLYLLLFSWGAYLVPPATGNFQSMSRYTLVCLAVVYYLSLICRKKRLYGVTFCVMGTVIMLINLILFLEGILVA